MIVFATAFNSDRQLRNCLAAWEGQAFVYVYAGGFGAPRWYRYRPTADEAVRPLYRVRVRRK